MIFFLVVEQQNLSLPGKMNGSGNPDMIQQKKEEEEEWRKREEKSQWFR